MLRRLLAGAIVVAAPLALAEPVHEQDVTGFDPSIIVGWGGFSEGSDPSDFGWAPGERHPSAAIHVVATYRLFRPLDLGLHVVHQWLGTRGLPEGTTAYASAAAGGLIARVHPLSIWRLDTLDLSLGAGLDLFAYVRQDTRAAEIDATVQRDAVTGAALPLIAGLDVFVGRTVAVGATAIWGPWWRVESCASQGNGPTSCQRVAAPTQQYFFLGVSCRLHVQFVG
ncbi:MAG: hypothetical protein HYZ28_16550 [Myxococcales bacterium]|nr:hypothetical protein [Myxococcales bacterium]